MSDHYENQQQKIDRLEGVVGPCREPFMNDEAYLAKLQMLADSKPTQSKKKSLFKSNKETNTKK